MSFIANNPAANLLRFFSGGSTERMRVDASGNVGIGVTNPTAKLDVAGSINVASTRNTRTSPSGLRRRKISKTARS